MNNEANILRDCKRGHAHACRQLVEAYSKHLYNVCLRYTREESLAKDCLQESWIVIFKNLDSYKVDSNLQGWMTVITVRKTLEIMRKFTRNQWEEIDESDGLTIHDSMHYQLELDDVNTFIASLDEKYRIVINMYLVEGFTHKEIAEFMNIQESTSRSLLTRARRMIQKNFESIEKYELRNIVSALSISGISITYHTTI